MCCLSFRLGLGASFVCVLLIILKIFCARLCRNCEDIAMSLLVANATGAPPIWVKGILDFLFLTCMYVQTTLDAPQGLC